MLSHDQDDPDHREQDQAAETDPANDCLHQGEVATHQVAGANDHERPGKPTDGVEQLKAPERHPGHPGEHRTPCAHAQHEPSGKDGPVTVPGEKEL